MLYPVGDIVRELNDKYIRADPQRISPDDLRPLLLMLRDATDKAIKHGQQLRGYFLEQGDQTPFQQVEKIGDQLKAWSGRLANYEISIATCPGNDSECALWTVTAPLFFGFYDGERGTSPATTPDLRTVFTLANQLDELRAWDVEQMGPGAMWRDVKTSSAEAANAIGDAVTGTVRAMGEAAGAVGKGFFEGFGISPAQLAGGVLLVGGLVWWGSRRKKKRAA